MSRSTKTGTCSAEEPLTAKVVSRELIRYLRIRRRASISMANVYLADSPWEADVLEVRKSGHWCEYEVKLSVEDFKRDFAKTSGFGGQGFNKHEFYADAAPRVRPKPKPKHFYFVMTAALAAQVEIPEHAGLILLDRSEHWAKRIRTVRKAPILKHATKVSHQQLYNLALKAAGRLYF